MTAGTSNDVVRRARADDVEIVARLINDHAERGLMVHRSLPELYERLRDFHVVERDGTVIGVVGLGVMWANLAEIYGLAVTPAARGQGLGRRLAAVAVQDAEALGVRRVFALTDKPGFFERLGFTVVARDQLPLKVWSERLRGPKHKTSDEWALLLVLEHVADASPPTPVEPDYESSIPTGPSRLWRRPRS